MGLMQRRRLLLLNKDEGPIPFRYKQVQYIAQVDDSKAYIDTGIYLSDELETEIHYYNDKLEAFLFGVRKGTSSAPYCNYNIMQDNGGQRTRFDYGSIKSSKGNIFNGFHDGEFLLTFHNRIITVKNCITMETDTRTYLINATFTPYVNNTILLFSVNTGGNPSFPDSNYTGNLRIYSAKFWIGGELVRDFVPCVRESDEIAGMYDTVTKQFFISPVSYRTFVAGPEI